MHCKYFLRTAADVHEGYMYTTYQTNTQYWVMTPAGLSSSSQSRTPQSFSAMFSLRSERAPSAKWLPLRTGPSVAAIVSRSQSAFRGSSLATCDYFIQAFSCHCESSLAAVAICRPGRGAGEWDQKRHDQVISVLVTRVLSYEVYKLLRLTLVLPATNAVNEHSFSALRRVKTYLRSTMNQSRLNHLMILHAHKHLTAILVLVKVI